VHVELMLLLVTVSAEYSCVCRIDVAVGHSLG